MTIAYNGHDMVNNLTFSLNQGDISVMRREKPEQWNSTYNLYHRPAHRFVADFIGEGILLPSHHNHALGEKIGIRLAVDLVVVFRH